MSIRPDTAYKHNTQDAHGHRFTTPLRRVLRRFHVTRKKPATRGAPANALVDRSNIPTASGPEMVSEMIVDDKLDPPPAPRPTRLASPAAPPSPISPLPPTVSHSSNTLTNRSGAINPSHSQSSFQDVEDDAPPSSSPMPPMPRGDLFQLGLTPVQSVRSIQSMATTPGCQIFAPELPPAQRVSCVNATEVDMLDVVNMDLDDPGLSTPTPSSRAPSIQWLPALASKRRTPNNGSTTAVFEGGEDRRRTTFMSKLVGSAWGLTGIGFTSMHGHRHSRLAAPGGQAQILGDPKTDMTSLPSIPLGKCSIEQAVLGAGSATRSRLSTASGRNSLVHGLPPANSTLRMTGSKSGRALDHLDDNQAETENVAPEVKMEERPKKKRRSSVAENFIRSAAPSPTPGRVTRAMAARQAEVEVDTPTRMTRSASKRLQELANANSPTRGPVTRSKSLKRL